MKKLRLCIVYWICRLLLPRDLWVGKHYGAYTCKYDVVFGKLDDRGVLQGYLWD